MVFFQPVPLVDTCSTCCPGPAAVLASSMTRDVTRLAPWIGGGVGPTMMIVSLTGSPPVGTGSLPATAGPMSRRRACPPGPV